MGVNSASAAKKTTKKEGNRATGQLQQQPKKKTNISQFCSTYINFYYGNLK